MLQTKYKKLIENAKTENDYKNGVKVKNVK